MLWDSKKVRKYLRAFDEGEPLFVIRARDVLAPTTIRVWVALAREAYVSEQKVAAALVRCQEIEAWQELYGAKLPDGED
jgi:hypothetical protein